MRTLSKIHSRVLSLQRQRGFFLFGGGQRKAYQIQRSLRFRGSVTPYLNRTFTSGDTRTFTRSYWIKRGAMGVQGIASAYVDVNNQTGFNFNASDQLQIYQLNASTTVLNKVTTRVFRDPSAWMHLLFVFDTNNGTNEDKVRLYVNGVRETSFGTNTIFTAASTTYFNQSGALELMGRAGSTFGDIYVAEAIGVDGQALATSQFVQTDVVSNQPIPKSYTGTYGTNGYYLDFKDPTSTTTLMVDRSGNGNNWTANNISVSAGVTYDSMLDVPLGGGGGERGNYCVFNPLRAGPSLTISDGGLKGTNAASGTDQFSIGTIGVSSGKWYFEGIANLASSFGVVNGTDPVSASQTMYDSAGTYLYLSTGNKRNAATNTAYGATFTTNDVIGVALDMDAGTITFYKNGASQGVAYSGLSGDKFFTAEDYNNRAVSANFGQRPFTYTPPSGFKALHTGNLTAASIPQPNKHFDVVLRTGTGASYTKTGIAFQLDYLHSKTRGAANSWFQQDVVRGFGANKSLTTNSTNAEGGNGTTPGQHSVSPTANGYTLGASDGDYNINGLAYVDYLWKAGGAASANNGGSISSQVSANQTAGFSIVTFTGTGANATVGHGLGVAPKMIIVKQRGASGDYFVFHQSGNASPQGGGLFLNLTPGWTANTGYWNNTAPTSSVFSIGTAGGLNANTVTHVAYCFAEIPGFSKFGGYTGNGSADGPFVYCGFRPRYVMVKRTDSTSDWFVWDTARDTFNVMSSDIYPNSSTTESAANVRIDFTANGFKIRAAAGNNPGISGATYVYAAFAETPFQYALAR